MEGVSETIKNEAKKQKGGFLVMLLGTLDTSLLGNMIARKRGMRAVKGTIRGCQGCFNATSCLN